MRPVDNALGVTIMDNGIIALRIMPWRAVAIMPNRQCGGVGIFCSFCEDFS
jgi:hypothetical protein